MKIRLHEIKEQDTDLTFTQDDAWVRQTVACLDEAAEAADAAQGAGRPGKSSIEGNAKPRPIRVHFNLRMVDEVAVVTGDAETKIHLVCSRCAAPFDFETSPKFSALFCKDPVMAGVAHLDGDKPAGQNHGFARHAASPETDQDLDITYLSTDEISLADVLAEQLQLQIPFQPLCREECKGICPTCGADQNTGRCACARIQRETPFSVLSVRQKDL